MSTRLPFHVRGAAMAAAIGLSRRLALPEPAGERLLDAMLGALLPSAPGYLLPETEAQAAGWGTGEPVATLGPQHGTVLLAGDKDPRTYRVGYRDLEGVVRLADDGVRADWAVTWWRLP